MVVKNKSSCSYYLFLLAINPFVEAYLQKGRHLVLNCYIANKKTSTLVDNGSEVDVLDPSLARALKLTMFKLSSPISLCLANKSTYQMVTKATLALLCFGEHVK
jgi:hypothetical protein